MVSCAHLSVALRVALGASTWPGKRGFTIRRSSPTQRRNGRAFASLTAGGGGLPIGVRVTRMVDIASFVLQGFPVNIIVVIEGKDILIALIYSKSTPHRHKAQH